MSRLYIFFIILLAGISAQAQNDKLFYQKMFAFADSLAISGQRGIVSNGVDDTLLRLDKIEPAYFFSSVGYLLKLEKYNDASVVYFVGYFRYKYYNSANPDYQPSGDGALFASLNSMFREPVFIYLKSDADNFIMVLEYVKNWVVNHDFDFFPKKNHPEKYNDQLAQLDKLLDDIKLNKSKYQERWSVELVKYKKMMSIDENKK